jgi:hypothetical protein
MQKRIKIETQNQEEAQAILEYFYNRGHKVAGGGSVESFLRKHPHKPGEFAGVREDDGCLTTWIKGGSGDFESFSDYLRSLDRPVEVRLNDDHTATVTRDGIKVGCQSFTHEAVERLHRASREARGEKIVEAGRPVPGKRYVYKGDGNYAHKGEVFVLVEDDGTDCPWFRHVAGPHRQPSMDEVAINLKDLREERPFRPGDRVRIRQWEDMEREFGKDSDGDIPCKLTFTSSMRQYCGKVFTVEAINLNHRVSTEEPHSYSFSTDMIEHAEK